MLLVAADLEMRGTSFGAFFSWARGGGRAAALLRQRKLCSCGPGGPGWMDTFGALLEPFVPSKSNRDRTMSEKEPGEGGGKSDLANIAARLEKLTVCTTTGDAADLLFGPPPPREDCPICMLPLPLAGSDSVYMSCCGKKICCGCYFENKRVIGEKNKKNVRRNRDQGRAPLQLTCPFCREPPAVSNEEDVLRFEKRMEVNDAQAFFNMAEKFTNGKNGLAKNKRKAFELLLRSAELGCAEAYYFVAGFYYNGRAVAKDIEKERMYLEKGAKAGDALSRHILGVLEWESGDIDLAVKNWLISASAGHQPSLDTIKDGYKHGHVSKDDFEAALRSFHAARKEEWSKERERFSAEKAKRARR